MEGKIRPFQMNLHNSPDHGDTVGPESTQEPYPITEISPDFQKAQIMEDS